VVQAYPVQIPESERLALIRKIHRNWQNIGEIQSRYAESNDPEEKRFYEVETYQDMSNLDGYFDAYRKLKDNTKCYNL